MINRLYNKYMHLKFKIYNKFLNKHKNFGTIIPNIVYLSKKVRQCSTK